MPDDKDQKDAATPNKGGFGAFSQQYRDRWVANHPSEKPSGKDGTQPAEAPTAPDAAAAPDAAPSDDAPADDPAARA